MNRVTVTLGVIVGAALYLGGIWLATPAISAGLLGLALGASLIGSLVLAPSMVLALERKP